MNFSKYFTLSMVLWLTIHFAAAQCPPGSIVLFNQAQIDSFPILYPGCKTIEGALEILQPQSQQDPGATDLVPLLGIDTVREYLRVYAQALPDLHGLDSLRYVGSDLEIRSGFGGENLQSLTGLGNLERVGGHLTIQHNFPKLKNLHGLDHLTEIGEECNIHNPHTESLDGLGNLRKVGGYTFDIRADSLKDLKGLNKLDTVLSEIVLYNSKYLKDFEGMENFSHGGIYINNAESLVNLEGLDNWRSGNGLWISNCPQLESLDGIENLETLPGYVFPGVVLPALWLHDNPALSDLSALDHPVSLGTGIRMDGNTALSDCAVQAVCDYLSAPHGSNDTIEILQNLPDCNSPAEVLSFCTTAANELSESSAFDISPNPLSDGQPLRILMNNDYRGKVRIGLSSLNGRLIAATEREKTAQSQVFEIRELPPAHAIIVRVSDHRSSSVRLLLRF